MSMDHKAFLFDTKKFHAEIEPVMKDSIRNTGSGTPIYLRASRRVAIPLHG